MHLMLSIERIQNSTRIDANEDRDNIFMQRRNELVYETKEVVVNACVDCRYKEGKSLRCEEERK